MTERGQLSGRTILIAPGDARTQEIADDLKRRGARVLVCPSVEIAEPHDYAFLDEAIENLFGYHWLIFPNVNSAGYFMRRFRHLGHEVSELDALRTCAGDEATGRALEQSQVHLDVIPPARIAESAFRSIQDYAGGPESLRGLNFLFPCAVISRDPLPQALEDAGARVDAVPAYRTASNNQGLAQMNAMLAGGGIDCVAFTNALEVQNFAQLFDTNDLHRLLSGVAVACADDGAKQAAEKFGLRAEITAAKLSIPDLAETIISLFHN